MSRLGALEHATTDDVERTVKATTVAQWGVAVVVMAGSMVAGGLAIRELGENPAVGVVTAIAVDLALAMWLTTAKRLRAHGLSSVAGWVLEFAAAGMTGYLNLGAAVFKGLDPNSTVAHWLLGIAHGFLPTLLILVTVAFGDAQLKLGRLGREREAAEQAERDTVAARQRGEQEAQRRERERKEIDRANGVLVDATDYHNRAAELRRQAELEKQATQRALRELDAQRRERERREAEENAAREAAASAAKVVAEQRTKPTPPKPAAANTRRKKPASAELIRAWISAQRAAGLSVTSGDVVTEFGHRRGDEARLIRQVEAEIDAELAKVASGSR